MPVTRKKTETALKATDYTTILSLSGRGALRALTWVDLDDPLAQTDTLRVTVDGDVLFDAGKDLAGVEELDLLASIVQNAIVVTTDATIRSLQRVPFHQTLLIEYKRAAAGTNGIEVITVFELKSWF